MIFKTPASLYLSALEEGYDVAVNTLYPRSLRVVTRKQGEFLRQNNGLLPIQAIASLYGMDATHGEALARRFLEYRFLEVPGTLPPHLVGDAPTGLDVWIHTSNRCNLTCGYCYISTIHRKDQMSSANRSALLTSLVFTARVQKLRTIKLRLAGGEPLLQFQAWTSFLESLRGALLAIGCSLSISVLTNLTVLNDDILAFARLHDVSFGVSLDGPAEAHDLSRRTHSGKGTFNTIMTNIAQLRHHNIRYNTNTVISHKNVDQIPDLTGYLIKADVPFRYAMVKGEILERGQLYSAMHASYRQMLNATKAGWPFSLRHRLSELKPWELDFQACGAGHSSAAVGVDGGVYFCHVQFGDSQRELANIASSPTDLLGAIDAAPRYHSDRSSDCRSCNYRHACNSGCPMHRVNGKDPNCNFYHEFLPIIYQIAGHERLFALKNRLDSAIQSRYTNLHTSYEAMSS